MQQNPTTLQALLKNAADNTPADLKAINAVILMTKDDGTLGLSFHGLRPTDKAQYKSNLMQTLLAAAHMVAINEP